MNVNNHKSRMKVYQEELDAPAEKDIVERLREWIGVPKKGQWPTRSMDDDLKEAADVIEGSYSSPQPIHAAKYMWMRDNNVVVVETIDVEFLGRDRWAALVNGNKYLGNSYDDAVSAAWEAESAR